MSTDQRHDQSAQAPAAPVANPGRRRFAQAGLGASAVLGVLHAKPVLASADSIYHCTVSGQVSGNMSRAPGVVECDSLGHTPAQLLALPKDAWIRDNAFNTLFGGIYFFADKNPNKPGVAVLSTVKDQTTYKFEASMRQVLSNTTPGEQYELGKQAVACYLNAELVPSGYGYPLTPAGAVHLFAAVFPPSGEYVSEAGTRVFRWNRDRVMTYMMSLNGGVGA